MAKPWGKDTFQTQRAEVGVDRRCMERCIRSILPTYTYTLTISCLSIVANRIAQPPRVGPRDQQTRLSAFNDGMETEKEPPFSGAGKRKQIDQIKTGKGQVSLTHMSSRRFWGSHVLHVPSRVSSAPFQSSGSIPGNQ